MNNKMEGFCVTCEIMVIGQKHFAEHKGHIIEFEVDYFKNQNKYPRDYKLPIKVSEPIILTPEYCCPCSDPNVEIAICNGCDCHDKPDYVTGGW